LTWQASPKKIHKLLRNIRSVKLQHSKELSMVNCNI
jgi:hypothetical protein